jgi:hypothetical protein
MDGHLPLAAPADATPASTPTKHGTLMLAGFWARGNAGDEAMLQCVVETMGDGFDYVLSVDEHGAYPGFWDWYPYAGRQIVNASQTDSLFRVCNPLGLLVGGGGLPLGFAAGQEIYARAHGLRSAIAGIDIWSGAAAPTEPMAPQARRYLEGFGLAYVRTEAGLDKARRGGFAEALRLGADWALNLAADDSPDVLDQPRRALVVVREDAPETLARDLRAQLRRLLAALAAAGFVPVLLPYAPEDERLLEELGLHELAPVVRAWWNPRRLKQLSARSGLTVSVGRLHPMIFAAPTGSCVMTTGRPTTDAGSPPDAKLRDMASDLGVDLHDNIDQAVAAIETGAIRPADPVRVAAAKARLDRQADELRRFFAGPSLAARA